MAAEIAFLMLVLTPAAEVAAEVQAGMLEMEVQELEQIPAH